MLRLSASEKYCYIARPTHVPQVQNWLSVLSLVMFGQAIIDFCKLDNHNLYHVVQNCCRVKLFEGVSMIVMIISLTRTISI